MSEQQTIVQALDQSSAQKKQKLGTIFWDGGKCYKYIQYKEGNAAVDGVANEMCYYYTLDGYKNNQVSSDLSDSVELGAGMLMAAMSEDEYGWIQIKGPATLALALTAGSDGDPLTATGSADGALDTTMSEAALTDNSGGTASDTIAAIGATYDQAEVRNAVASLAAKVNALLTASEAQVVGYAGDISDREVILDCPF